MLRHTVGFIGGGNMATAIMRGVVKAGVIDPKNIHLYDIDEKKREAAKAEYGVNPAAGNRELAAACDILLLATKPNVCEAVLAEMAPVFKPGQILVSIAAGWSTARLRKAVAGKVKILKVMPNTPAMVGAGVMIFSKDNDLSEGEIADLRTFFSANGLVVMLEEERMFATSGISGTIPACVAMYIEALADSGVLNGLPRDFALRVAAQAVMGSAKMVLESGTHPAVLKDQVCTPGGPTIEAVTALEEEGFRGTVIRACNRATRKSFEMLSAK